MNHNEMEMDTLRRAHGRAAVQLRQERGAPIQEEPGAVEPVTAGNAEELLAKLTVQEKVGQLF